jgi:hypothetical protein
MRARSFLRPKTWNKPKKKPSKWSSEDIPWKFGITRGPKFLLLSRHRRPTNKKRASVLCARAANQKITEPVGTGGMLHGLRDSHSLQGSVEAWLPIYIDRRSRFLNFRTVNLASKNLKRSQRAVLFERRTGQGRAYLKQMLLVGSNITLIRLDDGGKVN